jgi:hypothetical protein
MALAQGFEERLRERKVRRRTFHLIFAIFALITAALLEIEQSRTANRRRRATGLFISSRQRPA